MGQFLEVSLNTPASGYHHDIPSGSKQMLIASVDLPQAAAYPVPNHGLTQLFTNSNPYPIGSGAIRPGIQHKKTVCMTVGMVKPSENVIQFQALGKLHTDSPQIPFLQTMCIAFSQAAYQDAHERKDGLRSARDFAANEANETQEYFVYFKFRVANSCGKRSGDREPDFRECASKDKKGAGR